MNIAEYGCFSIASYTPPMDSFVPQKVIDDGILLFQYYLKRPITIL
jgi:hypothetical protein